MISPRQNDIPDRVRNAEETLRLIATMPAPEGLADRVQARLSAAPRGSFLTGWAGFGRNGWMHSAIFSQGLRGCAAAAIVVVVAGGGWSIYTRVQPVSTAKTIEMPARIGTSGSGFSNAGAKRTPDTLNGPVLVHPQVPAQQNVIAPMPSAQPQALAPLPRTATHKKKAATAK